MDGQAGNIPFDTLKNRLIRLNVVGESKSFRDALERVARFTLCEAPVLIEGETGTGKELIARAIHYAGNRRDNPFIAVNCGALPENLVENELFGHEKGAYTDARHASHGLIFEAQGGSLFLDEVEALSLRAQACLLRFLQEREYRPLGSQHSLKSDVRIITSSNVHLDRMVEQDCFRQDLFFRLNVLSVTLPPLRQRREDIAPLAYHFLNTYCSQYHLEKKAFQTDTLAWMKTLEWPGNIRELENLVHRELLLEDGPVLCFRDVTKLVSSASRGLSNIDLEPLTDTCFSEAKAVVINNFEKYYLTHLMEDAGGNVTYAAQKAGKERRALGKLLKKHGIGKAKYLLSYL